MNKLSKKDMIWLFTMMVIGIVLFKVEGSSIGWLIAGLAVGFIAGFSTSAIIAKKIGGG